jgi:FkbM family methyltransferase
MLCGSIFDNGVAARVRAYCLGLSDTAGLGTILLSSGEAATSGHQVTVARSEGAPAHTDQFPQGVVTRTLDGLVYEDGLPCPTHIKIDVDGLEHAIVEGGARLLADPRLRSVLIELDLKTERHRALLKTIEAAGFRKDDASFQAVLKKTTGGNALVGNVIFTRGS